jgi:Tfp pilus assembly ATPase PilU
MRARNGWDLLLTAEFPPAIGVDGRFNKPMALSLSDQHNFRSRQ